MGLVRAFAGLKRASRLVTWVLLRVDRHRTASAGLVGITPSQSLTSYADSSPGIQMQGPYGDPLRSISRLLYSSSGWSSAALPEGVFGCMSKLKGAYIWIRESF
jgi:hypothetical protein